MRVWLVRLRTILAMISALFLLWKLPFAYRLITTPETDPGNNAKPVTVLRVWLCEEWTGTGMQWLTQQVSAFEKANKGTRVVVRRSQKEDWLEKDAILPDILLFEAGALTKPDELLIPQTKAFPIRDSLLYAGDYQGLPYAVPVCYGGIVRIVNETKPEGITLTMQTAQAYQDFVSEKSSALIATVREARKLAALQFAGKGFPFHAEPYDTSTNMLLFAGLCKSGSERVQQAESFISFLLSDGAQNALPDWGLLPVSKTANPIDEGKQPLLSALENHITRAVNAFD